MVEVVGTAPTSAMFITKFVYRYSWKTNISNIEFFNKLSIHLLKKHDIKLLEINKQENINIKNEISYFELGWRHH